MVDDSCACCGDGSRENVQGGGEPRWIDHDVLEAELPVELRMALARFFGVESVETLQGWAAEVQGLLGDHITTTELCVVEERTEHWGDVDGERYQFRCFYDAVILAASLERPVDIRTESPNGAVIEARAVGSDELTVTPESAALSFGIDPTVETSSDDGPQLERAYTAMCPYVNAFPSRDAYERWAETVSAVTIGMPFARATALAAALTE